MYIYISIYIYNSLYIFIFLFYLPKRHQCLSLSFYTYSFLLMSFYLYLCLSNIYPSVYPCISIYRFVSPYCEQSINNVPFQSILSRSILDRKKNLRPSSKAYSYKNKKHLKKYLCVLRWGYSHRIYFASTINRGEFSGV